MTPLDSQEEPLDWEAIRARLAGLQGRAHWAALEELARHPALDAEADHDPDPALMLNRRAFLKLMGASLALAGLSACVPRRGQILPYVEAPEAVIPGKPLYFATAMSLRGFAIGLLAESHMGRPTKIEGNPSHPASLGATDVLSQASVLSLYDPDRSKAVLQNGTIASWEAFQGAIARRLAGADGSGVRLLSGTVGSPTLRRQIEGFLAAHPGARWVQYEPLGFEGVHAGTAMAFGRPLWPVYDFSAADVIVSLAADFLAAMPGSVRYSRDFAARRQVEGANALMNRLYVAEPSPTVTGASADHRMPVRAVALESFARQLAVALGVPGVTAGADDFAAWVGPIAADLRQHRGRSLVIAGDGAPPAVQAIAHALNARLGNLDRTVSYTAPLIAPGDGPAALSALTEEMRAGRVELLVMLETDPVATAPPDLGFAEALARVPMSVHHGLYLDATGRRCHWHVPATHYLEHWSDALAHDGTASIVQPLIEPLFAGRSAHALLATLSGAYGADELALLRATWQARVTGDFEAAWREALRQGVIAGSAPPRVRPAAPTLALGDPVAPSAAIEAVFVPDPSVFDGRFANNAWLQELPKPLSTLTWDNAALISPLLARRLGLENEDMVRLRLGDRALEAPIWIMPGHADDSVSLPLGYGRDLGAVSRGLGFDAYVLRPLDGAARTGLVIEKTGRRYPLAAAQLHDRIDGLDLLRVGTLAQYRAQPGFAQTPPPEGSLYPEWHYPDHRWAMAIDLNVCTGCSACVMACVAENNIPVVGKEEVRRGREMHWLKVDRYYQGAPESPATHVQPRPCMHCEKAPCEVVCPVRATAHSDEGLNEQVYNRCIGTRYCSNNCPYKVRRFNFFQYTEKEPDLVKMARNPDVTVRSRGVMEKCTYCVQRINQARIEAEKAARPIRDGEVVTACAQACPTRAIVFGDLNDPNSAVSRQKASKRNYAMLAELNTQPRTTYQARLMNPNPAWPAQEVANGL